MNILGSFNEKSDGTHLKGILAEGEGIHNLSTETITGTTYNVGTANISNIGYTAIVTAATSSNVYQLDIPYISGLRKTIHVASTNSTSLVQLYAGSTAFEACFLSVAGNTSNSMVTMYKGAVLELLAISTNKWLITTACTAGTTVAPSFSSST